MPRDPELGEGFALPRSPYSGHDQFLAAGYTEFDPIASNEDVAGRARNRRIEITLQPQIDEMVAVPSDK